MSSYDQWKLSEPETCNVCDFNGYNGCSEHADVDEPDPDRAWDNRKEGDD